jgi:hypothetical protein
LLFLAPFVHANDVDPRVFGGPKPRRASVFKFCTIAARWNFVACAGKASQAHALEAVMNLQMGEPHLDAEAKKPPDGKPTG